MIGIFDSGVGGLTVVKEIFRYLPEYQVLYFGDTARLPYGTKGADFVQKYSTRIVDWLVKKKATVIVIACHTSSAWAADALQEQFSGIPIFEMITPAAKGAAVTTQNNKIGIIGTPGTIESGAWTRELLLQNPQLQIYSQACPLFVPLVEEGWIAEGVTREIAQRYLAPLTAQHIDTLILGCTHYPVLTSIIREVVGPEVTLVNPAESLAKEVRMFLRDDPKRAKKGSDHQFFFSDKPYHFQTIRQLCFQKDIVIQYERNI